MGKLDGKIALITGAARGQGRSHAVRFAEEGADIIATDLCGQIASVEYAMATEEDLAETVRLVESTGRKILATKVDVRDYEAMERAVTDGVNAFGGLDIVVANAGIMPICGDGGRSVQAWRDAIDVMLTGVFNTTHLTVPILQAQGRGGSIVIISSTAGMRGLGVNPGSLGYGAAKSAVVNLTRSYAKSLGPDMIRVNSIHPTAVNTPMVVNEAFGVFVAENPQIAEALQNTMPVPMVEPLDITNAILYLVSDEGRYVTGQQLAVDAGFLVR